MELSRRDFLYLSGGAVLDGAPATERFTQLDLFPAGAEGYASYRIPGLVRTGRGTLLAYAEARRTGRGDWDQIDIVLKRSTDGGRTWDGQRRIATVSDARRNPAAARERAANPENLDGLTYNNPVAIVDRRPGVVHFLFCLEYARCFYMKSVDDGRTFSAPVEITAAFEGLRAEYDWRVIATGPGHGIQLRSGRLVVPVWLSTSAGKSAHHPSNNGVIYSDDGGRSWRAGEFAGRSSATLIDPSEAAILELADGRVVFNSRSESKVHRRMVTYSRDGATGWTPPEFHHQLAEPICMASLTRLSGGRRPNRILFANPASLTVAKPPAEPGRSRQRRNLTVRLSYDEGQTWPVSRTIEPDWSGYSDLATGTDGTIYCLYEAVKPGADLFRQTTLRLASFNLEWLSEGADNWEKRR
ncbi:MAG: exo-alpha-sialidase [Acidobacteriota bacterium]